MIVEPLKISGAWLITPVLHGTPDRLFLEQYRFADLSNAIGRKVTSSQVSFSVSKQGDLRGIHYTAHPPGQTKIVTCVSGSVFDVVIDLRVNSTTFGEWQSVQLDDVRRQAVYISEGLGHGYCVVSEYATLMYQVSPEYNPTIEREIYPFDKSLHIQWPVTAKSSMSQRDHAAPTLDKARKEGLLPISN